MLKKALFLCLVVLLASAPLSISAQEDAPQYASARDISYEVFAQLPRIENVSVSPNGRYLAIVYPVQGEAKFYIFDLSVDNPEPPRFIETGETDILWIEWLSNDRLLIRYGFYADIKGFEEDWYETRLLAFDRDGGNALKVAEWNEGFYDVWLHIRKETAPFFVNTDDILSFLPDDPDHILIQAKVLNYEDLGVYKVNIHTSEMTLVQEPMEPVWSWYADDQGRVRFGTGWDDDTWVFMIRETPTAEWKRFDKTEIFEDGFDPLSFGFEDETLFVKASINTGRETIYKYSLATGAVEEKVYENPNYDVDDLFISVKDRKILAATYTDDYPTLHFFDEDFEKMDQLISKALGGRHFVYLDYTRDFRYFIIRSYSSNDPGMLYWYDNENKELSPIWEVLPGLDPTLLSEVKKVEYLARDGLELHGYLTVPKDSDGKNLPTIMLIHGGPWARDDMSFNAEVQFLASRGYAVFQPNFRGSSGFGDRFRALGYGEWGKDMQTDIIDGLNWLVKEGITDPDRVCIAGGSYGGYAALMGVGQTPDTFKCAFAFAPVTDIKRLIDEEDDKGRGKSARRFITPGLDRKDFKEISPVKYVKEIKAPILLIHGDEDSTVSIKHSEKMAKELEKKKKKYQFIVLAGAGHGIIEEKDRMIYFKALEDFLGENLGQNN